MHVQAHRWLSLQVVLQVLLPRPGVLWLEEAEQKGLLCHLISSSLCRLDFSLHSASHSCPLEGALQLRRTNPPEVECWGTQAPDTTESWKPPWDFEAYERGVKRENEEKEEERKKREGTSVRLSDWTGVD